MSIALVTNCCSLCSNGLVSYCDLGQQSAKEFIPMLADPSFITENLKNPHGQSPGLRIVVAGRAIFLCFSCIQKALLVSEPAIIT